MTDTSPLGSQTSVDGERAPTQADESQPITTSMRFVSEYALLLPLGEGGMGEVWAARDHRSPKSRVVALKTTKQKGVEAAKTLWDEARIASLIEHPNVCRVHELGRDGDQQFLVMDYCDGASLHDLLEAVPGGRLPMPLAVRIASEVAAGLHAAHELEGENGEPLSVVHRDVSPQNVLISSTGHVTITDFGVARAAGQAHKATETGEMKGKLSYMAPEQVTTKHFDRRADLFALGCVLYQATLGRRPFHGQDALSTLYQLLEKPLESPRAIEPDFPEELEAILVRALAKDPADRFPTGEELQRALEAFLVQGGHQVSQRQIGALMTDYLGDRLRKRRAELTQRSTALDEMSSRGEAGSGAPRGGSMEGRASSPSGVVLSTTAPSVGDQDTLPSARTAPRSRGRWRGIALVGLGLTTVGALWATLSRDASRDGSSSSALPSPGTISPTSSNAAEPSSATDSPAPGVSGQSEVLVEVTTVPPTAAIWLDDVRVGTGAYTSRAPGSAAVRTLRIEATGLEPVFRQVVFDRSQVIHVELSGAGKRPATTAPKPAGAGKPPGTAPRSEGAADAGTSGPTPPRRTGPQKPPRTLDADNPFASP